MRHVWKKQTFLIFNRKEKNQNNDYEGKTEKNGEICGNNHQQKNINMIHYHNIT
jgi:hypothetical protein